MPTATELLRAYVSGWLASDAEVVTSTLADDVVVTESHGPTFLGAENVRAWVERWAAEGDVVHRWDLISMVESADGT